MNAGHTPGPWSVNGSHVYAPDGAILAQVHNPGRVTSDYPLEANARLIAAAPDLLDLVLQFRNDLKFPVAPDSRERRLAAIDAAIAKATGA